MSIVPSSQMRRLRLGKVNAVPWLTPSSMHTCPPWRLRPPWALLTYGTLGCSMCEHHSAGNQTGLQRSVHSHFPLDGRRGSPSVREAGATMGKGMYKGRWERSRFSLCRFPLRAPRTPSWAAEQDLWCPQEEGTRPSLGVQVGGGWWTVNLALGGCFWALGAGSSTPFGLPWPGQFSEKMIRANHSDVWTSGSPRLTT